MSPWNLLWIIPTAYILGFCHGVFFQTGKDDEDDELRGF